VEQIGCKGLIFYLSGKKKVLRKHKPTPATETMKILVVGSGGREHALAWKLSQSPKAEAIYVAPGGFLSRCNFSTVGISLIFLSGNGGTAHGMKNVSNINIDVGDFAALVEFATKNGIDLVVPGPEAPLVDGIEGYFRKGIAQNFKAMLETVCS